MANRAERRSKQNLKDADVILWDNEPHQLFRWLERREIHLGRDATVSFLSEANRDAAWGREHGWEFTYYPDGSKTIRVGNGPNVIRLPAAT